MPIAYELLRVRTRDAGDTTVYVEGRVQIRKYTGNDGVERTSVDVIANDLIMLSSRDEGGSTGREPVSSRPSESGEEDFDDLPF